MPTTDLLATEAFLPFDLEALFISSISILTGSAIDQNLAPDSSAALLRAYAIFDDLSGSGNLLAKQEKEEVLSFEQNLQHISREKQEAAHPPQTPTTMHTHASSGWETVVSSMPVGQSYTSETPGGLQQEPQTFGFENIDDWFTSAQILDTVNAIDTGDAEWMSQTMMDYNLW